jgi:hypothetical protein
MQFALMGITIFSPAISRAAFTPAVNPGCRQVFDRRQRQYRWSIAGPAESFLRTIQQCFTLVYEGFVLIRPQ